MRTYRVSWAGWKGKLFQWGQFYFNDSYVFWVYRLGPIELRVEM